MGLGLKWFQAASIRLKSNMLGVKLGAWSQHLLGGRCLVLEFETKKDLKCLLEVTWLLRKQGCITLPPHLAPMSSGGGGWAGIQRPVFFKAYSYRAKKGSE